MDMRYGVDVSNKFDIIGLNVDSGESAKNKDEIRKSKKVEGGEKTKLGSNKQNTKKSTPNTEVKGKPNDQNNIKKEVPGKDNQTSDRPNRGGRFNREGRDGRDNKENDGERKPFRRPPRDQDNRGGDENVPPEFREKPEGSNRFNNRYEDGGERGRGRGRGRGGFSRGGRGRGGFGQDRGGGSGGGFGQSFEGRGKRDFDRHSGSDKTGVKAVDKREGSGRRNWGSFKDDIKNVEESQQQQLNESGETPENWNQTEDVPENQDAGTEPNTTAPETVNEEDPQPKQMTLKEYRQSQNKSRLRSQFQIRKAGEGVDNSQWRDGAKVITNSIVTTSAKSERRRKNSEDEEQEDSDSEEHGDQKRKNKNLNIEITFNDNNRRGGRGNRRGRGPGRGFYRGNSPRGGGGRGGGDRKYREAAPRVDDEKDFPSLVKSVA